jgi:hypothetical protein
MTIRITLSEEEEQEFRKLAMRLYGYRKGALTNAARDALLEWMRRSQASTPVKEPTKSLRGLLQKVSLSSVELQHEATKLFTPSQR